MFIKVYIGKVKSEEFDYDLKGNYNGYTPSRVCACDLREREKSSGKRAYCNCSSFNRELYSDIVGVLLGHKVNGMDDALIGKLNDKKQTDWGCFVIKLNKADLVLFLSNKRYKGYGAEELLEIAKGLSDTEDYLLTAVES